MKGHLRERSPGHWAIILDAQDATGQRKRRWHSFQGTKREAQIECARLISEQQGGGAVDPSKLKVCEFLDRFERDWVAVNVGPHTAGRYHGALGHLRQHLGELPLQKVQAVNIVGFYAALTREGLHPNTIRLFHVLLHRAFSEAKRWKLVRDNVVDDVVKPKGLKQEIDILQPDQAQELLRKLEGHPLYLIAYLGLNTGMRRNEMLGLRWRDVDLNAGKLTIEQSLEQTRAHGIRTKAPKTESGRRTISLPTATVTELRNHWRTQQEQRLACGMGRAPADGFVLAAHDGAPQSPNAISKAWPVAMKAIGMKSVTLHSLRHTHASMLIASGMDILTISRRLGHSSATITLNIYGHLIHGTDRVAADIMDRAFGSKMVAANAEEPGK
jgi:integrase